MRWLALTLFVAASASAAAPAPRRVRLDYAVDAAAASCPAERPFRDSVTARLGYEPFVEAAPTTVVVRFSRAGAVVRATVGVQSAGAPAGEKVLTSPASDCAELAAATSLAVSMAIDPLSPTREPRPPETPVTPPPPPAPPPPPPAPASTLTVELAAGPSLGFGQVPALGVGLFVEGRLRWSRVSIGLDLRPELPGVSPWPPGSIRAVQVSSGLSPCVHLGPAELCGVLVAGVLRSEGEGFTRPASATTPQLLAGLRGGARLALGER